VRGHNHGGRFLVVSLASVTYLRVWGAPREFRSRRTTARACSIGDRPGQDRPSRNARCGKDWKSDRSDTAKGRKPEDITLHQIPEGRTANPRFAFSVAVPSHIIYLQRPSKGEPSASLSTHPRCLVLLLHAPHVSLVGNKPFARVQSYLPESATQHPHPVLGLALPCPSHHAPLLARALLHLSPWSTAYRAPGSYRLERPALGVEGGSSSSQSFRYPFETHRRARIPLAGLSIANLASAQKREPAPHPAPQMIATSLRLGSRAATPSAGGTSQRAQRQSSCQYGAGTAALQRVNGEHKSKVPAVLVGGLNPVAWPLAPRGGGRAGGGGRTDR